MKKSELNDRILDQVLTYAAEKELDHFNSLFPSDDELASGVSLSPDFERRMDRYFQTLKRRENSRRLTRVALRICAVILVLLIAATTVIFSVEAFRIPFLNLFHDVNKDSTTIRVEDKVVDYQAFSDKTQGLYLPTYVPEGYSVASLERMDPFYRVTFVDNKSSNILFYTLLDGTSLGVDSEDANVENLSISDIPAQYFEKGDVHHLVFKCAEQVFLVKCTLPKDEMVRIAESMKLNGK